MSDYDAIVIGAGHNGLTAANYLARQGMSVLVAEAADECGGLARNREFHEGFQTPIAHSINQLSRRVVDDLALTTMGYEPAAVPLTNIAMNPDGQPVMQRVDGVLGVSAEDAAAYGEYQQMMQRYAELFETIWLQTPPPVGGNTLPELFAFARFGINLRMLGTTDMREFFRMVTLPTRDLMDERFDSDLLKSLLAWEGLIGSRQAPRSPNNSILMMLLRMSGEHSGLHAHPATGVHSVVRALVEALSRNGGEIKTGVAVDRILIEPGAQGLHATGVQTTSGETITSRFVLSSADPKTTFLKLVGVEHLEIGFTNRIRRIRTEGLVAKVHLALDGAPHFRGVDVPDGRMIFAPNLDAIEFAFDPIKYGEVTDQPVMEVVLPSMHDASLAPEGKHVLSAHVMYVPHQPKEGWSESNKQKLLNDVMTSLQRYAPSINDQVLGSELLTPADLEQDYGVTGGHWHHGEIALDQVMMMRPTYGAAQYRTPVASLFLCGAGSHPGGGLMGAAGRNAAFEVIP